MYNLRINSETGSLKSVVVGIANDRGILVHENNPKISKYLKSGTFPTEKALINQVNSLANLIKSQGIEVIRPENVPSQDQIFTRDIGFVIGDTFVVSNMKKSNRKPEQDGIQTILQQMPAEKIVSVPEDANIEGGDVIVHGKHILVGLTGRTNFKGFEFLQKSFSDYEVIPFHMFVTDNPATNILHLDCAFQPVGENSAIIYEKGFVHGPEAIYDIFGDINLIKINQFEMYHMYPNIISLAPDLVITDSTFERLNQILNNQGIKTLNVNYLEVSKLGGLFRCSTMPLARD